MSFPRYASYKDSGVEWLGEVPEHWVVAALKRRFQVIGGSTPKSDQETFWDGEIIWVTPADLSKLSSLYISDSQRKISSEGFASCGTTLVPKNSVILSTRAPIGSLAIAETDLCTNQGCKSLVPFGTTDAKFFGYLLSISAVELNIRGKGTTFLELSGDELSAFIVPVPPASEQQTIASFLDCETAKIDALIAEQQRLIELLKEKRQAVISHAVTKGLSRLAPSPQPLSHEGRGANIEAPINPGHASVTAASELPSPCGGGVGGEGVPMKDSGIEWLGEVPEHWELWKLKQIINFFGGGTPSRDNPEYWNGDIPWVSPKDMKVERINSSEEYITAAGLKNSSSSLIPAGQVLMVVRSGILKHTIPVAINEVPVTLNQDMKALNFIDGLCLNTFFLRWVQGLNDLLLLAWAKQGATVESIEHTYLEETVISLPSIPEQRNIITFLDRETTKLDTLTTEAQRAIELLKERRTALISAAVTGKIDVRTFHP
jgi:type I restriction enzyme S subunit